VYLTFSFAPIRDAAGNVVGVLNTGVETTRSVVAERRMRALRDLAARTADTPLEACAGAAAALAADPMDVPFALLYLLDDGRKQVTLAGGAGLEAGSYAAPRVIDVSDDRGHPAWPLARVLTAEGNGTGRDNGSGALIDDMNNRFHGLAPPAGAPAGTLPPRTALLLPLRDAAGEPPTGVLVAGLSPHRPLDESYGEFLDLIAGRVGAGIARARARQQERERLRHLTELDRTKTEFFSNISHEFRTPLTLLLAPLEELLGRGELPTSLVTQLDVAARNARRLLTLVNNLLDFSRIEAGRMRPNFLPTDLSALTADVTNLFRSAAERVGLDLVVRCPPLPEPVWVDRLMWEKVVSNLLSNALKFTFHGRVEVELRALAQHPELTVRDTGVGIPKDELPHLFQRFHRVRGVHGRTEEGSGIGLALVHQLVGLHFGRMRAASEEGLGSTFTVWMPVAARGIVRSEDAPVGLAGAAAVLAKETTQ